MATAHADVELYGDLDASRRSSSVGGLTAITTGEGLRAGAGVHVTDDLVVGAEYAFARNQFDARAYAFEAHASYLVVRTASLELGASAGLALGGELGTAARLGVGLRYRIAPEVTLFVGGASTALTAASGLGPISPRMLGQELSVGLGANRPSSLDIPAGIGLQPVPRFYVGVATTLAHVGLHDDATTFLGADVIPIDLAMLAKVTPCVDAGLFIDVPYVRDSTSELVVVGLTARYTR